MNFGIVDTVPLLEVRDLIGKIGRLGRGVKTKVKTWEYNLHLINEESLPYYLVSHTAIPTGKVASAERSRYKSAIM